MASSTKRKIAAVLFWFGVLGFIGQMADPASTIFTMPVAYLVAVLLMVPYLYVVFREGHSDATEPPSKS